MTKTSNTNTQKWTLVGALLLCLLALLFINIFFGTVHIDVQQTLTILTGHGQGDAAQYIITQSRIPQAITAMIAGAGLSISGLMLQTAFHNPLAGPSVLGISSGASLGVAIVMMATGGALCGISDNTALQGYLVIIIAALCGALAVTALLLAMSKLVRSNVILLIAGMMLSYLISSIITLLTYSASQTGIQSYVFWGMGDFSHVTITQLPWLAIIVCAAIALSMPLIKPLNALLLGEQYAQNLGVNVSNIRHILLLTTGILCAAITAFCGPISFIGIAVPHITRFIFRTDNFRTLMPMTIVIGACATLLCNAICTIPSDTVLPLAAVTPILGAPVIIWIVFKR